MVRAFPPALLVLAFFFSTVVSQAPAPAACNDVYPGSIAGYLTNPAYASNGCICADQGYQWFGDPAVPCYTSVSNAQPGCSDTCTTFEYENSGGCFQPDSSCVFFCDSGYIPDPTNTDPQVAACTPIASGTSTKRRKRQFAQDAQDAIARAKQVLVDGIPLSGVESADLCSDGLRACPIGRRRNDFECVDTTSVETCGGCVSEFGTGTDCTDLEGVLHVSCRRGTCDIESCQKGYRLQTVPQNGKICVRS